MKEIYNEGRVVGLSAWEIYVRHILATNPTATPLNEQQWLSASLSSNTSMIMRIPAGTSRGVHDFKLPENSDICGCSTIYASIFEGEVTLDETGLWATRVDDYGRLIQNDLVLHPVSPGEPSDVPTKENPIDVPADFTEKCKDYIKVSGGLMFQPGDWNDNIYYEEMLTEASQNVVTQDGLDLLAPLTNMIAAKSLEPDMSKTGFIRLAITGEIIHDVLILFHGFSYKALVSGEVGYAYVPDVGKPEDGGFLGPAVFPWGCQIVFLVTNEVLRAMMSGGEPPIGPPIPEWVNQWSPEWSDFKEPIV